MDFTTQTQEVFLAGIRNVVTNAIKSTFKLVSHKLVAMKLSDTRTPLPTPLAVKSKLDKISWVDFSTNVTQVPEGLIGGLVPYTNLVTNDGLHLVGELRETLLLLNNTLANLINKSPADYNALINKVKKHVYKQGEFYKVYRELVVDNGRSHASISSVLYSPTEALKWHTDVKIQTKAFDNSDVKEWTALLNTVSSRLDMYVDDLTTTDNQSDVIIGQLVSQAAYDLAERTTLVSVIAMAMQMNHKSVDEFSKKLMKY
jgi:hypothetical protein